MKDILKQIGSECVFAIVSDNATNVHKARKLINKKYSHIENVYCISHYINLIVSNIVDHIFANQLLYSLHQYFGIIFP